MPGDRQYYYQQKKLWAREAATYQEEVLRDILDNLPNDLKSILDVGCGDGYITNALPDNLHVVGADISEEALKHLKREGVKADITALPFAGQAFDLVMANDVLEHLSDEEREKAVGELARVADKYVMITVPFMEDLLAGLTQCGKCGHYYHINYHSHSFDLEELRVLLRSCGFTCIRQILTGDIWNSEPREVVFLKRLFQLDYPHTEEMVCPQCGSTIVAVPEADEGVQQEIHLMGSRLHLQYPSDASLMRTECLCLYVRNGKSEKKSDNSYFLDSNYQPVECPLRQISNCQIDFSRPQLFKKTYLPRYSPLPYYVGGGENAGEISLKPGERLLMGFFCPPLHQGGNVNVKLSGTAQGRVQISLSPYDDVNAYRIPYMLEVEGRFDTEIEIPAVLWSQYGLLFALETREGEVSLKHATLANVKTRQINCFRNEHQKARYYVLPDPRPTYLSLPLYGDYILQLDWMTSEQALTSLQRENQVQGNLARMSRTIKKLVRAEGTFSNSILETVRNLEQNYYEPGKISNLVAELDVLQAKYEISERAYEQLKTEHKKLKNSHEHLSQQLESAHLELAQKQAALEQLHADTGPLKQRVLHLERVLSSYQSLEKENETKSALIAKLHHESISQGEKFTAVQKENRVQAEKYQELLTDYACLREEYQRATARYSGTLKGRLMQGIGKLGKGSYEPYYVFKQRVLANATPDISDSPRLCQESPSFLMICHDQNIDRRIVQEALVLIEQGWDGRIVALSFDNEDCLDEIEGIPVHRIGLKHVVPDCPVYWTYQNRNRLINWWGRHQQKLAAANWKLYKLQLLLKYKSRQIYYPLPFDNAFYTAASLYKADLVFAHDLPALPTSIKLAREWGSKIIYDAHELYYEQKVFSRYQKRLMRAVEKEFLPKCDQVFTVNQSIAEEMKKRYGVDHVKVLLNAIDPPPEFDTSQNYNLLREHLGISENQLIILFQGGLYPHRNLNKLVKAMRYVADPAVTLVLMGDGPLKDSLKNVVKSAKIEHRVYFKDAVPQKDLLYWTASADIGIIPYPHVDLNTYYCTPNKLFEFIQAGVPILANDLPELRNIIKNNGLGEVGAMRSPRQIARLIDGFVRDHPGQVRVREKVRATGNQFSWASEQKSFLLDLSPLLSEFEKHPVGDEISPMVSIVRRNDYGQI